MKKFFWLGAWAGCTLSLSIAAQSSPTSTLEERIDMLEKHLADTQAQTLALQTELQQAQNTAGIQQAAPVPQSAAASPQPMPTLVKSDNFFNPQIAVFLDASARHYQSDPADYVIPGFTLGGEAGLGTQGLSLSGTEFSLNSTINDQFFGNVTLGMHDHAGETELDLEEAYVQTTALPWGLNATGGRFFSAIGYLNDQHPHVWDFTDAPLVYSALLGQQLYDDGLRISWIAPSALFLELGGEIFRGSAYPAAGEASSGFGTKTTFVNLGGDIGISHSWLFGIAQLWADAIDRAGNQGHTHDDHANHVHTLMQDPSVLPTEFTGNNDITIVNFVWKWAPDGNPTVNNAILQTEYFYSKQDGTISADAQHVSTLNGTQQGGYVQAIYQFMPRWRIGARYDLLWSDNTGSDTHTLAEAGLLAENFKPERTSGMLDFLYSENSLFRLQYNHDRSTGLTDHQVFLQYVMSFGAHGAHPY